MSTSKKSPRKPHTMKKVPISDIPEVQEFVDLDTELQQFKAAHHDVFMPYADLVDRRNTALEAAEKVVRSRGVTCGPFINHSTRVTYNAEKMIEELGEDLFFELGGQIVQKPEYTIDKEALEKAIATKKIPAESLEYFRTESPAYRKPKPIT